MEMAPPCWCYTTVYEYRSTREQDLRIPASVMKVLFHHKSLYACVCVMEPHSGNLVESGTSRFSPCQMQQVLFFIYQAWVIWKHSQFTYISVEASSSFLFGQFKMQSALIQKLSSSIYSILDNFSYNLLHMNGFWNYFQSLVKNFHGHTHTHTF